MIPVLPFQIRPGRRRLHRIMAVVLLATVAALALPTGPAVAVSPTSALAATAQPLLRTGARGAAVVSLQRRLATLHYDVGPIDGVFGYSTYHGVVAFQKVNGLVRDGIVGPRTWAALASPIIPRPRRWRSGSSLEVNLTRQVVYLARQGVVLRILDASTGKATTPTPTGNFSVYRRIDGWRQSTLGLLWRPNYFYRGYAVTRLNLGACLPCQPRVRAVDACGHEPSVVAAAHRHACVGLPLTLASTQRKGPGIIRGLARRWMRDQRSGTDPAHRMARQVRVAHAR